MKGDTVRLAINGNQQAMQILNQIK